jgi:predicted NAD-dependent protein-ADP-ribosyltransferase YbiA (DUF1768 family)
MSPDYIKNYIEANPKEYNDPEAAVPVTPEVIEEAASLLPVGIEIISPDYGVVKVETNPTKQETQYFVDLIKPQIKAQTYKENKGTFANEMFHYGLMWARNNSKAKPVKIQKFEGINNNYYNYHALDQNGNSLPSINILQPIIDKIEKSLGIDMSNYDSVIGNIYLDNQYVYPHKDTTESVTARNYPVIVYTLGNESGLGIVDNSEGKMTFANSYDIRYLPSGDKLTGYTNEVLTKNGSIYTFGLDGKGRFELTHSTPTNSKKTGVYPPITLPNGNIITNYTITLTFRRAQDLEPGMPTAPAKIETESTQPQAGVKPGVSELFNSTPELAAIGTPEQYSQYLDTIFPDSKVKDIVYHGSKAPNIKVFNKSEYGYEGISFTYSKNRATGYAKDASWNTVKKDGTPWYGKVYSVIINAKELGKDYEILENLQEELVVFEPDQIHILGNKQDIEGFKKFVSTQPTVGTILPGPETKINIYAGTRENAELSNFADRITGYYEIDGFTEIQGVFRTVEGAFQAAKVSYTKDLNKEEKIDNAIIKEKLASASGSEAKALGKKIKGLDKVNWDANSSDIMKKILLQSFKANPDALAKLLATGNATLTHTQDKGKWGTEFPKLLMEVRDELRSKPTVEPVGESQLDLFEQEIEDSQNNVESKIADADSLGRNYDVSLDPEEGPNWTEEDNESDDPFMC